MLIYVDSVVSENYEISIQNLGGLVYSDTDALMTTAKTSALLGRTHHKDWSCL